MSQLDTWSRFFFEAVVCQIKQDISATTCKSVTAFVANGATEEREQVRWSDLQDSWDDEFTPDLGLQDIKQKETTACLI